MIRKLLLPVVILFICFTGYTQQQPAVIVRPKLVVGIVIDQMRWDFLYRYYDRYKANGGFKRMMNRGFNCENTLIPYVPTITACGHSSIYTGSVPSITGITGNLWWDRTLRQSVYCTEDNTVKTVGAPDGANGKQSPRNMLTNTICDELRLATNFKSKVIGLAMKDRGGILTAGHTANGVYWYDTRNGNWITSDYYMQDLPGWVKKFNGRKLPDEYYKQGWNTLFAINTYTQSTADQKAYESRPFGTSAKGFPYDLKSFVETNYGVIAVTPYGNTMTVEMAKAAIEGEELGKDAITDFLAISFSSPDYVGHTFGPNSIEAEDIYLRLDQDLGEFLNYLDTKVGSQDYLLFLSADHGAVQAPGFLKENNLPSGIIDEGSYVNEMNSLLKQKFGGGDFIVSSDNYQIYLDHKLMESLKVNPKDVKNLIIEYLQNKEAIANAIDLDELMQAPLNKTIREMIANGYYPTRSGDVEFILKPGWISGFTVGTTHGLWNPYDAHIPLLWYGWNIKPGKTNREVYMTDIAPTIAAMLYIQMPNGCVGHVIQEVLQ